MSQSHLVFEQEEISAVSEMAKARSEPHVDLRPKKFEDYPGQEKVCANLKVYTQAARMRGRMLDHCLFYGPPGLGKTTLAHILAHELGCEIKVTSGPVVERSADLMGLLAGIEPNTILFIDEIHRLPANVEEVLYSAMEDNKIDFLIGQGASARAVKFELPPFTLVGATTRPGALSAPLRDRFGIVEHLEFYSPQSLCKILERSSKIFGVEILSEAAMMLAGRCRGTPRIANVLLRRVMDFALVADRNIIEPETVETALFRLGIDFAGLSRMDREFLRIMRDRYEGGPVGLDAIASALNEERNTLEDVHEAYLVYCGFILRTPRGRVLSLPAFKHLEQVDASHGVTF